MFAHLSFGAVLREMSAFLVLWAGLFTAYALSVHSGRISAAQQTFSMGPQ